MTKLDVIEYDDRPSTLHLKTSVEDFNIKMTFDTAQIVFSL